MKVARRSRGCQATDRGSNFTNLLHAFFTLAFECLRHLKSLSILLASPPTADVIIVVATAAAVCHGIDVDPLGFSSVGKSRCLTGYLKKGAFFYRFGSVLVSTSAQS